MQHRHWASLLLLTGAATCALVNASTPASHTVTVPTTDGQIVTVTWTGTISPGSFPGSDCTLGPDPLTDHHALNITVPAGTYTSSTVTAVFSIDWADGGQDAILTVMRNGTQVDSSDGGNPHEQVVVTNPAQGSWDAIACPFTVNAPTAYTGKLELTNTANGSGPPPLPPAPPYAQPDATLDTGAKVGYENFEAPGVFTNTVQSNGNTTEYLGRGAGEPSVGVNWNTATAGSPGGVTNFQSDLQTLFVTFDDTCPANGRKASWINRPAPTSQGVDSDPIGFTNRRTGRTFAAELTLLSPTCKISYTDDDGLNWTPTSGPGGAGVDHQTVGGGPYHTLAGGLPPPYDAGFDAFYYCSQDIAAAYCLRSDDGGVSWKPQTQMYTLTSCGGLHGHVKVAPNNGTVYVPNANCGGNGAVAVSADNGQTWAVRPVREGTLRTGGSNSDPAVGIDSAGKVYFGIATQNGTNDSFLTVATSTDEGTTWTTPANLTSQLGISNVRYPAAVGGDPGRAAIAFYGTSARGNANGQNAFWGEWHLYVAHTFDGGGSWTVTDATPSLPMQRGCIWTGGGGDICRNLLDFFDIAIDKEGRVTVGYVNGCPGGDCSQAAPGAKGNDYSATATIARQSSGPRLLASVATPATSVPGIPIVTARRVGTVTHLGWSLGDTGNSPVTAFQIWRGTASGAGKTLVATLPGDQSRYDDATATDYTATYYYDVIAVNALGASCANNEVEVRYVGDSCPGIVMHQNDADHPESAPAQNGANPQLAIDYISAGEPIEDLVGAAGVDAAGGTYLKFTMKVTNLAIVPPNSRWRMVWNSYSSPGQLYYVGMRSGASGAPEFDYGTVGDAGLPAVLVLSETKVDAALPESNFLADGTITVYVPKDGVGSPQPGDLLGALGGKTFTGDTAETGTFQRSTALVDHTFIKGVVDNGYPASTYTLRDAAHATDNHIPTATFSSDTVYGNPPLEVNFDATQADEDGDAPGGYLYDFGDGPPEDKSCGAAPYLTPECANTTHTYADPGYYTATLTASDDCGKPAAPLTIEIHVNAPPVANAGADFDVSEGATALLSAALSSDADDDVLEYAWTQTAGPAVTLTGANTANASFTAPDVSADTPLTFELAVTDVPGGLTTTDTIVVTVHDILANLAPVANAGAADLIANEHALVTLNGTASTDPNGDVLSYAWTQIAGPTVALTGANSPTAHFTAPGVPSDTVLTFQLMVSDPSNASDTDDVNVTVRNTDVASDGGEKIGDNAVGALPFGSLLLLGLAGMLRRRRR